MSDGHEGRTRTQPTASGYLRASAALMALVALVYAIWKVWTAIQLSSDASLGWRTELLLLEGGVPLLLALGFGCAAYSVPAVRRAGWQFVIALVLFLIVWTWLVPVHPLATGYTDLRPLVLVAVFDHVARTQLVEAAYRKHGARLFAFGTHCCIKRRVEVTHAQDAVQDIFAALLAGHDKGGPGDSLLQGNPSQLKAYLFKAVQLRIQTVVRSESRRSLNESRVAWIDEDDMAPSSDELYAVVEIEECVATALAKCPQRAVHAYRLVHENKFTYREAGEVMGITTQTVGAHLNLVAKRLQTAVRAWQASTSGDVV